MQIEDIKVGDKVQLIDNKVTGTVIKITALRVRIEAYSQFHKVNYKVLTSPSNLRKV